MPSDDAPAETLIGADSSGYTDPELEDGNADPQERKDALAAMPQGNAETGDQVDREAFDVAGPDDEA